MKKDRIVRDLLRELEAAAMVTNTRRWKKMKKIERIMELERETKNTYRYAEQSDGQPPAIGTIYVQKWAVGNNPPRKLKITVEEA